MDPSLLTTERFWSDPAPFAAGGLPSEIPDLPDLRDHVFFQTSGSTGTPKWIALSKGALLASAEAVNRHLEVSPQSSWALALPLHHVGGFGVAARAFAANCAFRDFGRRWDASAFAPWLAENEATHTSLVPAQVHDLVAAGIRAPSSIRAVVVGGGHLDVGIGRVARSLGWPVLASYGMTEAASQIATQGLESLVEIYQPAPIPLLPVWQADVASDQRLRIAGLALFSGLLVREQQKWIFQPRAGEWYQTEDRVLLEDRQLTPLGRADLRVKVLGELVDLEAIEHELAALSQGKLEPGRFVVVAVPDERAGHALVPVFDAALDPETIAATLSDYAVQAPGFRRLRAAVIAEYFPRSPLGKPCRAEIAGEVDRQRQG